MDGRPASCSPWNVTDRVKLEEQLRQAQKMEAVGRLAGGVAHDFNNLLTAISGNAQLLRSELEPGDARVAEVDEILLAGERAATLTRQLLAFSRRQVLQPRALSLNESIEEVRSMLVASSVRTCLLRDRAGPGPGPRPGGSGPADAGTREPCCQRQGRDAQGRDAHTRNPQRDARRNLRRGARRSAGRTARHAQRQRHGRGHGRRRRRPTLRALLHDQRSRQGHGPGAGHRLWNRPAVRGQHRRAQRARASAPRFEICLPQAPVGERTCCRAGSGRGAAERPRDDPRRRGRGFRSEAGAVSVLERQGYAVLAAEGPAQAEAIAAEHPGRSTCCSRTWSCPAETAPIWRPASPR
jgi:hypothetical protein